jgi:hypothetical protein
MARYVDEMTRDELVAEVRDMLARGTFCHHEVGDPTVLPAPALRDGVKQLRLRVLAEGRHLEANAGASARRARCPRC